MYAFDSILALIIIMHSPFILATSIIIIYDYILLSCTVLIVSRIRSKFNQFSFEACYVIVVEAWAVVVTSEWIHYQME